MKLYKLLDKNGNSCHGGKAEWHLPRGKRYGKWMPSIKGKLIPCNNGYHLCRIGDLLDWGGDVAYEAETNCERITESNKVVVRNVRLLVKTHWNKQSLRLFACDCAERALKHVEKPDSRSTDAIKVSRRFAFGLATKRELDVATNAARDVAANTATSAAWDATWRPAWRAE